MFFFALGFYNPEDRYHSLPPHLLELFLAFSSWWIPNPKTHQSKSCFMISWYFVSSSRMQKLFRHSAHLITCICWLVFMWTDRDISMSLKSYNHPCELTNITTDYNRSSIQTTKKQREEHRMTILNTEQTLRRVTLKSEGISLAVGSLYVPGPCVKRQPGFIHWCSLSPHLTSSTAIHPIPWTNAPSICRYK